MKGWGTLVRAFCFCLITSCVNWSQGLLQRKPSLWDRCWEEGKRFIQMPAIWEDWGLLSQSPSSHLCAGRGFIRRERESRTKTWRGVGWKVLYIQTSTVHSDKDFETGQVMARYVSPWFLSSWFDSWGQQIWKIWVDWRSETISLEVSS